MCEDKEKYSGRINFSRRGFMVNAGIATLGLSVAGSAFAELPKPQNAISPDQALARLMSGNERYATGKSKLHDFKSEREALVGGQNPYAAILSCADSRIAPEYAFDSARGDLFVVRVAGNFVDDNGLASLEYAAKYLGTPLFMVLGHQHCGAVSAAISTVKDGAVLPGQIPELVEAISSAVGMAMGHEGDTLDNTIRENVRLNVAALKGASPIMGKLAASGKIKVVGGVYNLSTGRVDQVV